ncbi:MAG: flagellar hook-basal body complex protein, partial [Negativicutes bacterium]|nr:flagellar hook-basal body complex protein [Negativicutes bacterium]
TNGGYNATTVTNIAFSPTGATAMSIAPDFTSLTQVAGTSTVAYEKTGYAAGTLDSVSLNKAGEVVGTFSNGQNQVLAQVALAAFNNPGGLTKLGSNTYSVSANSGEPQIGTAATGGRGSLTPGALEMSNVDLSQQFSDMIVTQRGFQSNSKIITVSDEMLETLVNMKR